MKSKHRTGQSKRYGNIKSTYDGIEFGSKKEMARYIELKILKKAGVIDRLEVHPKYEFVINGFKVCTYSADFRYHKAGSILSKDMIVEDVKSPFTRKKDSYRIKIKLMKAVYGIEIKEI